MKKDINIVVALMIIIVVLVGILTYKIMNKRNDNYEYVEIDSSYEILDKEKDIKNSNKQNIYEDDQSKAEEGLDITLENAQDTADKTEEKIEKIAKEFVKAVNKEDWETVEKYSNSQIVSDLKKYNISNMSIDYTTLSKNPNNSNGYYYRCSYDIDYNGLTTHDLGLGKLFCIDNVNNTFVISSPFSTGV